MLVDAKLAIEKYRLKIESLSAQVAELKSQLATALENAERYRHLRDNPDDELWELLTELNEGPTDENQTSSADAWDAAIDAARSLPTDGEAG